MGALWTGRFVSDVLTGAASADAATAGRLWLVNNVAVDGVDSHLLVVRRVVLLATSAAGAGTPVTRVTAERMTFTGTPTGTQGTPAAVDSEYTLPSTTSVRTASTGMTPTAGAVLGAGTLPQAYGTPNDVNNPIPVEMLNTPINFRPGQGLVIRQADAGSTDQKFIIAVDFSVLPYGGV